MLFYGGVSTYNRLGNCWYKEKLKICKGKKRTIVLIVGKLYEIIGSKIEIDRQSEKTTES